MTQEIIFYFGTEIILVRIEGSNVFFGNSKYGAKLATIDGLRLNQQGVEKEFPDLKGNPEWKKIAIERFKAHIKKLGKEDLIADYLIEDLKKYGYQPKYKQKKGFRPEALNGR